MGRYTNPASFFTSLIFSDNENYTLFTETLKTKHCSHEILPEVKPIPFKYVRRVTSMSMNYLHALLELIKDHSSHKGTITKVYVILT